jgi:ceramide glucosyltransferase
MLLALLAAAGCVYEIAAIAMLRRFFARKPLRGSTSEGVTLLKPLHGAEPLLEENLASFLAQDYPAPVQIVCGVRDKEDPAIAVIEQLKRDHPDRDIELVTGPGPAFANRKIANLATMLPAARHSVLVLSDSDMAVSQDYLAAITGALAQPGVGVVTCAYRGRADRGIWSQVSAAAISYLLLPGVVTGYQGGMAQPCMGSTIAMSRKKLDAIGGFARFAGVLADDYAIGQAVAETGARIEIPPLLLVHGCAEESLAALWRQKLRWAATIRGIAPRRHAGSIVTYPLPLAVLATPFVPAFGLPLVVLALVIRFALAAAVDRRAGARSAPYWTIPLAECTEFLAFLGSFVTRKIDWRGSRLTMHGDGRIAPLERSR